MTGRSPPAEGEPQAIAARFVAARREAFALAAFPGEQPTTLEAAYAVLAVEIGLWGEPVAGWKVGRITGDAEARLGVDRFVGPIFASTIRFAASGELADFPCFEGGFAAFEAEIVAVVATDQPADLVSRTPEQARRAVAALHVGIEVAGSPLAGIHAMGPLASIAGFGNNAGLIVGPAISNWTTLADEEFKVVTRIGSADEVSADASALPGGIWTATAFALDQAARLGRPAQSGDYISTGAITGVHPVTPGTRCSADFGQFGHLYCQAIASSDG